MGEPGVLMLRGVSNFFHLVDEVFVTIGLNLGGRGVVDGCGVLFS